jgi:predicted ABC-type ATPase
VFAGPNGSGKTTLYNYLVRIQAFHSYFHINPDAIARDLPVSVDLTHYPFDYTPEDLIQFLDESPYQKLVSYRMSDIVSFTNKIITLKEDNVENLSYPAAAIADFIRKKCIISESSFSFESVFSHASKIDEINDAKKAGFKTYLYFIATSDPLVNSNRVQARVKDGGHPVPNDKILSRYYRTMGNLYSMLMVFDNVFLFDNSNQNNSEIYTFFAEKKDGVLYTTDTSVPQWFDKYALKKAAV